MAEALNKVPCCPSLDKDDSCDVIDLKYSLTHDARLRRGQETRSIPVEVTYHLRISRCTKGLALGDLLYTTTLLPGEKVRVATRDRTTSFSFDSDTSIASYTEHSSEEQAFLSTFSNLSTDFEAIRSGSSQSDSSSVVTASGKVSGALETFFVGGKASAKGTYDGQSSSSYLDELRTHLESSHHASVESSKSRQSRTISEVSIRRHAEGETESHFEATSRLFENKNACHAVTYLFHQINKLQEVTVEIVAITRRVVDPAADTKVTVRPLPATATAAVARDPQARFSPTSAALAGQPAFAAATLQPRFEPIAVVDRRAALASVDADLVRNRIATRDPKTRELKPSQETRARLNLKIRSSLPTPGVMVRACLDECESCEPLRQELLKTDLERKKLENELLKQQINLLDKHKDYRCCPAGEMEEGSEEPPQD